ncbi:MAG: cell envelope integrity protein CreD [Cellvibrionaceae bacterium]
MQKQLAIKILVIVAIGIAIIIPINLVKHKIYERQGYLEQAKYAVAESWTGEQLLMTPILVIPYQLKAQPKTGFYTQNQQAVSTEINTKKLETIVPTNITGSINVSNKNVFKGIYEVPVYNSEISFSGQFSAEEIKGRITQIKSLPNYSNMEKAYISIHISDMRGIDERPKLTINKKLTDLYPGSQLSGLSAGLHSELQDDLSNIGSIDFNVLLSLRGMGSLSFITLADDSHINMQSDWPHPKFIGSSLPKDRSVSSSGFNAQWQSTRYSSNSFSSLKQCNNNNQCHALISSSSGVSFIDPVDIYLQSERSTKYAMLFIGLSFITFFIFEHIKQVRIHPIQYGFVGLSIATFYLLLISLAEHIAFHWAYLIGVTCCSSLLLFYVRYMLKKLSSALLFCVMTITLYGLLYVIVQAEDFALLMGAFLVFIVLATLMVVTRKIDWYSLSNTNESNNKAIKHF